MTSQPMNDNEDRRVLDCFYTQFGTKLFVENGVLVEQKLKSSVDPNLISVPSPYSEGGVNFRSSPYISSDPPPPRKQLSLAEKKKLCYERCVLVAHEGLAYYNQKHPRQKYALVRPIHCNSFIRNGIGYHGVFLAKPLEHDGDSAQRCFFAQVTVNGVRHGMPNYLVTHCRPLDGTQATLGCQICNSMPHPVGGFRKGNPQSRITRSSFTLAYGDTSGVKPWKEGEGGEGSKYTFCLKIEDLDKYIPNYDASDTDWMDYM